MAMSPVVRNCTFYKGRLNLYHWESGTWTFRANLFYGTTNIQDGVLYYDYNGYAGDANRLTNNAAHDVVTNLIFESGKLGDFYLPTNSAFWQLVKISPQITWACITSAQRQTISKKRIQLSMRHFITWRWIPMGWPINSDGGSGEGVPEWIEDANGNGTADPWESDWTTGHGSDDYSPGYLRCEYRVRSLGYNHQLRSAAAVLGNYFRPARHKTAGLPDSSLAPAQ